MMDNCWGKRQENSKVTLFKINFHLSFVFSLLVQTLLYGAKENEEDVRHFLTSALQCVESLQQNEPKNLDQERLYIVLDDHARTIAALHVPVSRYDPRNRDIIHLLE